MSKVIITCLLGLGLIHITAAAAGAPERVWVLWFRYQQATEPVEAFPTQAMCQAFLTQNYGTLRSAYVCLPDTINLRCGPSPQDR